MIKILSIFLSIFLLETGWLFAEDLDKVIVKINPVSTNATISQAVSSKISGYIERVDVWFNEHVSIPWVKIISSNDFTGTTTTIYNNTVICTNFSFYPRISYQYTSGTTVGTNGAIGRIPVLDEKIYLIATNAVPGEVSPTTITAVIFYEAK